MTVYVCRDKDAACAEFLASERCANCPTLKNATTPDPALPNLVELHQIKTAQPEQQAKAKSF